MAKTEGSVSSTEAHGPATSSSTGVVASGIITEENGWKSTMNKASVKTLRYYLKGVFNP